MRGLAVWLIPSEFMDVNYGKTLRRYLTERVTLLHIHRFCPTDVQFTDALVSSAVVVFRKVPPPPGHALGFHSAAPSSIPRRKPWLPIETLRLVAQMDAVSRRQRAECRRRADPWRSLLHQAGTWPQEPTASLC